MTEFEIYLPTTLNDGTPVDPGELERLKKILLQAFGGYTQVSQRSEGAWRMGGVTFHDEVTIVRVLDDGSTRFDMARFKQEVGASLRQEDVLIIRRAVSAV